MHTSDLDIKTSLQARSCAPVKNLSAEIGMHDQRLVMHPVGSAAQVMATSRSPVSTCKPVLTTMRSTVPERSA